MDNPILFLDYDGVLHPDAVYQTRRGLELRPPGQLLMHADVLETMLDNHPEERIVLSTSWVHLLSFKRAPGVLPSSLQARVIGRPSIPRCLEPPSMVTTCRRAVSRSVQLRHALE